jgi:hypothetical protein
MLVVMVAMDLLHLSLEPQLHMQEAVEAEIQQILHRLVQVEQVEAALEQKVVQVLRALQTQVVEVVVEPVLVQEAQVVQV